MFLPGLPLVYHQRTPLQLVPLAIFIPPNDVYFREHTSTVCYLIFRKGFDGELMLAWNGVGSSGCAGYRSGMILLTSQSWEYQTNQPKNKV